MVRSDWGRDIYIFRNVFRIAVILAGLLYFGAMPLFADVDVFDATHVYNDVNGGVGSIQIVVDVDQTGGLYLWQYTVTNNSFNPAGGNGFSGFELALPMSVPDIANVTSPNASWNIDCCSGLPVEWDITNTGGPGILVGQTGVFSFTTLPRAITNSTGWFHTWVSDSQTSVSFYSLTPGELGPEVPNVLLPPLPTPEPATFSAARFGSSPHGCVPSAESPCLEIGFLHIRQAGTQLCRGFAT